MDLHALTSDNSNSLRNHSNPWSSFLPGKSLAVAWHCRGGSIVSMTRAVTLSNEAILSTK
jgi:hypothetical protein